MVASTLCFIEPGQMSLHDVFLIHGSDKNTSAERRSGIALRYMPTTSHFNRDLYVNDGKSPFTVDFASRPIFLLR